MSRIPNKPIGQSVESNLLWHIAKKLESMVSSLGTSAVITTTSTTTL